MSSAPAVRSRRRAPLVFAGLSAVGVAVDVALDPAHRHVPLCPFHAMTGGWCPLCGSLRAVEALARWQWQVALHDNVLLVVAVPALALWWIDWLARGRARRRPDRVLVVAVIALAVVFGVVRNLPFAGALRPV